MYLHFVMMDGSREICLFLMNKLRRAELMIQTLPHTAERCAGKALLWCQDTCSEWSWEEDGSDGPLM